MNFEPLILNSIRKNSLRGFELVFEFLSQSFFAFYPWQLIHQFTQIDCIYLDDHMAYGLGTEGPESHSAFQTFSNFCKSHLRIVVAEFGEKYIAVPSGIVEEGNAHTHQPAFSRPARQSHQYIFAEVVAHLYQPLYENCPIDEHIALVENLDKIIAANVKPRIRPTIFLQHKLMIFLRLAINTDFLSC